MLTLGLLPRDMPVAAVTRAYVEGLRGNASLSAALTGITAAVAGVIANLAVYFALHGLFAHTSTLGAGPVRVGVAVPALTSLPPTAALIAVVGAVLLFRLRRWAEEPLAVTPSTRNGVAARTIASMIVHYACTCSL